MITSPSETTPQKGMNNIKTKSTGVADQEIVTPPDSTQAHVNFEDNGLTSVSLWDTAYEWLKEDEETRELLSAYEDLLSRVPIKGSSYYSEPMPW